MCSASSRNAGGNAGSRGRDGAPVVEEQAVPVGGGGSERLGCGSEAMSALSPPSVEVLEVAATTEGALSGACCWQVLHLSVAVKEPKGGCPVRQ